MSMEGNSAVKVEMARLLDFIDSIAHNCSRREQLRRIRKRIEETKQAAEGGWL